MHRRRRFQKITAWVLVILLGGSLLAYFALIFPAALGR